MTHNDGGGGGLAASEVIAAAREHGTSLDGLGATAPQGPFAGHPELLVGAAFLGGVLLAGLVSRLGS